MVTYPQETTKDYYNKRYFVDITYNDSRIGKQDKHKRVFFGVKGELDYAGTND